MKLLHFNQLITKSIHQVKTINHMQNTPREKKENKPILYSIIFSLGKKTSSKWEKEFKNDL